MNLSALKLFSDVVRCRSFSQAATMGGITQSAVSQAVIQLEKETGVQLIDRGKRPFVLTAEGEIFYSCFCDIIHRYETALSDVQALRQEMSGLVRVAAIYSVGLHDMSTCMQSFMSRYPKARVRLQYLLPNRVHEAVLNGEVDIGVISYPTQTRELAVVPLRSERMVLVCHPQHHLAGSERIALPQINGENFVAFDRDLAICKELDRCLREHQVSVRKVMEFDNVETIKQAIEIGAGLSILPEPTIRKEILSGALAGIPIEDANLERPIGIIHRHRMTFTPVLRKFIDVLRTTNTHAGDSTSEVGTNPTMIGA